MLFNYMKSNIFLNMIVLQTISARLEELLQEDKQQVANIVSMVTDESRQKELLMEDEEEDFLDEGIEKIRPPFF